MANGIILRGPITNYMTAPITFWSDCQSEVWGTFCLNWSKHNSPIYGKCKNVSQVLGSAIKANDSNNIPQLMYVCLCELQVRFLHLRIRINLVHAM